MIYRKDGGWYCFYIETGRGRLTERKKVSLLRNNECYINGIKPSTLEKDKEKSVKIKV